jgi:hypothetical protein
VKDAFDNLKSLHLADELVAKYPPKREARPSRPTPPRPPRTAGSFYHVPTIWLDRAYLAATSKEQIMISVRLFRHWRLRKPGEDTVVASNAALNGPGFSRQAKLRALQNLAAASLLEVVEQRGRRSPRVRIVE